LAELAHLMTVHRDHAQQLARPEHGDREHRPDRGGLPDPPGELGVGSDVGDMDGAALESGAPPPAPSSRRDGILLEEYSLLGGWISEGDDAQMVAFESED